MYPKLLCCEQQIILLVTVVCALCDDVVLIARCVCACVARIRISGEKKVRPVFLSVMNCQTWEQVLLLSLRSCMQSIL
jgi:hypothetical protein